MNVKRLSLLLLVSACIGTTQVLASAAHEHRFLWDRANTLMTRANSIEAFREAASAYRQLAACGVRNGPLFYNYGTALLMAEEYDDAVATLLRAERYLGHTWEIRRNLSLALAKGKRDQAPSLPWYRFPLFWHYGLDAGTRITLTSLSFVLLWVALFLRVLGSRRGSRSVLIAALAALVIFGSSTATTLIREATHPLPSSLDPQTEAPAAP